MFWWCSVVLHDIYIFIYKISKVLIPIDFQETFVKLERDTPDTKGGPAAVSDIKGWRPFCTDVPWSKGARIEAWMTIHDDFHSISLDIVADVCFKDLDTLTHSLSLSLIWWLSEGPCLVDQWKWRSRYCGHGGPNTKDSVNAWAPWHLDDFWIHWIPSVAGNFFMSLFVRWFPMNAPYPWLGEFPMDRESPGVPC